MDELVCGYSVTITWTGAGRPRDRQWAPDTPDKFTPSPKTSRKALELTQPHIQWTPETLSLGQSGRGV